MHLLPLILLAGAASAISDCARANIAWPTVFTDVDGLSTNACCTNNRGVDCGFSDKEEGVGRSCRIQCDENGFITSIHLQNIQLSTSTVPDFSTLTKLTYLDISMNADLIGSIPQSLPPALKTLHMNGCKITGPIPPLPGSLTDINLSSNQLSGSIPALPANLNSLNLNNNQLGGSIPALPPSLKVLSLRDNRFEGSLPSLPNSLTSLELQNNHLSGFIPTPFNFKPQVFDENCFVNAINLGDVILPISVDDPVLVTTTTQHRNVILPITVDDPVPVTTTTDNINVILPISLDPGPATTTTEHRNVILPITVEDPIATTTRGNVILPITGDIPTTTSKTTTNVDLIQTTTTANLIVLPISTSSDPGQPTNSPPPPAQTQRSLFEIASSIAAGPIPTFVALSPVADTTASTLLANVQSITPTFYAIDNSALRNSLGSIGSNLAQNEPFKFLTPRFPSSSSSGSNGGFIAIGSTSFTLGAITPGSQASTLAKDISSTSLPSYKEFYYTIPSTLSTPWIAITYLPISPPTLLLQANADNNLLFFQTIQVSGPGTSLTLITGSTPLSLQTDPNIPRLPTGEPAYRDDDFLRNATAIVTRVPKCAVACSAQVPGFTAFVGKPDLAGLDNICQTLSSSVLDAFTACVASTAACTPDDVTLASQFTTLFPPICKQYTQPAPTVKTVDQTLTITFAPSTNVSLVFFEFNITDASGNPLPYKSLPGTSPESLGTVQFKFQTCDPVKVTMKYGLCEGAVVAANQCSGQVTGHFKQQDIDPTKVVGSGFYGQKCGTSASIPVTNPGSESGSLSTGVLIGGIGGAIAAILCVSGAVYAYRKKQSISPQQTLFDNHSIKKNPQTPLPPQTLIKKETHLRSLESPSEFSLQESVTVYRLPEKQNQLFAPMRQASPGPSTFLPTKKESLTFSIEDPKPVIDNVDEWTVEDVANWVLTNHGGRATARRVQEEEIDGKALLLVDVNEFASSVPAREWDMFRKQVVELQSGREALPAY